jgi:anti-sigma B factor antagonist
VLNINVSDQGQVSIVEADGRIDSSTASQLGEAMKAVIEDGFHNIVLDIGGIDYMSSAGLREIVMTLKSVRKNDGDLRMSRVSERVYEVLELSGLDTILQFYDSQADAVSSFQ